MLALLYSARCMPNATPVSKPNLQTTKLIGVVD